MAAKSYNDLTAYRKAYELAMEIFEMTKKFPKEETYSLTDQIRRSSRSVCSCIGEAYRKRKYEAYFVSKVTDADMENTETKIWLEFARDCNYISKEECRLKLDKADEIGKLLYHMENNPEKYLTQSDREVRK